MRGPWKITRGGGGERLSGAAIGGFVYLFLEIFICVDLEDQ